MKKFYFEANVLRSVIIEVEADTVEEAEKEVDERLHDAVARAEEGDTFNRDIFNEKTINLEHAEYDCWTHNLCDDGVTEDNLQDFCIMQKLRKVTGRRYDDVTSNRNE